MSSTITGLTVAALVVAVAVLVWAVETRLRAVFARPADTATFRPVPPGTRWLVCHDTACGHMTTRHQPQPDGTRRCERAAEHRGDVRLTREAADGRLTTTDTTQGD